MPDGFQYSIENITHKSIDSTYDLGSFTSATTLPLNNYKTLYPLQLNCWDAAKKSALAYAEKIGKEIIEKVTTGTILSSE